MGGIKVKNIFAAVSDKSVLDPLLEILDPKSVKFWGTEGTVKYLIKKGFSAKSVVSGFDFDGRVKSLDRAIFARILADRTNQKHMDELANLIYSSSERSESRSSRQARTIKDSLGLTPFDLVVVDLYKPNARDFPESMDIGGQALIRAAIKNYQNVVLAFDEKSIKEVTSELEKNSGLTTLAFRKKQAAAASKFIADRCKLESDLF